MSRRPWRRRRAFNKYVAAQPAPFGFLTTRWAPTGASRRRVKGEGDGRSTGRLSRPACDRRGGRASAAFSRAGIPLFRGTRSSAPAKRASLLGFDALLGRTPSCATYSYLLHPFVSAIFFSTTWVLPGVFCRPSCCWDGCPILCHSFISLASAPLLFLFVPLARTIYACLLVGMIFSLPFINKRFCPCLSVSFLAVDRFDLPSSSSRPLFFHCLRLSSLGASCARGVVCVFTRLRLLAGGSVNVTEGQSSRDSLTGSSSSSPSALPGHFLPGAFICK